MRILVVGAGIAGLSLTASLRSAGIDVICVEKESTSTNAGFAIGVWENGVRVLRDLGISPKGLAVERYLLLTERGERIRSYEFSRFPKSPAMLHMLREDLHESLSDKAGAVRFGSTVNLLHETPDGVSVTFTDGHVEMFDAVIGADGTRSRIRDLAFPGNDPRPLGWRGWYFWFDTTLFPIDAGAVEAWRPGMFFGAFPHGGDRICGYLGMPFSGEDTLEARRKVLDSAIMMVGGDVRKVLCSLDPKELSGHAVVELTMPTTISGRVLLIGDAAHAMEPFAGLGASMALEDAAVLSQELRSGNDVPSCLANFERRRRSRVALALRQTRRFSRIIRMRSLMMGGLVRGALRAIPPDWFTKDYRTLLQERP